jgi:hypothetical protein
VRSSICCSSGAFASSHIHYIIGDRCAESRTRTPSPSASWLRVRIRTNPGDRDVIVTWQRHDESVY